MGEKSSSKIVKRGLLITYDLSDKEDEWVVASPYLFWSHRLQDYIEIPRWFVTDLASIPKAFRWFISVNERHRLATLPHDLLYCLHKFYSSTVDRKTADLILRDFCEVMKVPLWKRQVIYFAVRIAGWVKYNDSSKVMYAPMSHRKAYKKQFPELSLRLTTDCYIPSKKAPR